MPILYLHLVSTGVSQVCPFGWVENPANDACYLLSVTSTKYKFFDAVTKCQSQEAELLIIHTEAEKVSIVIISLSRNPPSYLPPPLQPPSPADPDT